MTTQLDDTKIAARYAKAFFEDVLSAGKLEPVMAFLPAWWAKAGEVEDIVQFFGHPAIGHHEKQEMLRAQFPELLEHPFTLRLLDLLLENGRFSVLDQVIEQFSNAARAAEKIVTVEVQAPFEVDTDLQERLKERLIQKLNCSRVELQMQIDPKLLGGLRLKFNDKVIDGSFDGKLKLLEKRLNA